MSLTISLNTTFFIYLTSLGTRDIVLRFIILDILGTIAGLVSYLALAFIAFSLGGYLLLGVLGYYTTFSTYLLYVGLA